MRQLSAHDAGFLYSDTSHSNSNITLIQIYDQSTAPGGKVRFKSILAHIESRLAGLPIFRSKLQRVPLDLDHPYWVDDTNFDLEYHVRHIALPKPGDWRQFCIQASRIHARPLDLNRPLWEIYVVEGLDSLLELPVGSFALLTKIHHAAVDAEGGSRIAMLLHDMTPHAPKPAPPKPWFPRPAPGPVSLLARSWLNSVLSPLQLRTPWARKAADSAEAAYAFAADLLVRPAQQLLTTRFNSVVSAHRVFDTRRFMVEEFDAIRALVPGASIDDAVLAVCGGTLRAHLQSIGELPAASLSAVMPVHARQRGIASTASPASWLRVQLGTDLADPVQRLAHIQAQTAAALGPDTAVPGDEGEGSHQAAARLAMSGKMQGLSSLGATRRAPSASCTITNVAGPSVPLYLNGARMTYFSAIMPINDGMGLVFAVTSYDGRIIISPTSCRELLPDPEAFTQQLRDSFQQYLALARAKQAVAARSARPRASARGAPSPARPKARRAATAPRAGQAGRPRSAAPAG